MNETSSTVRLSRPFTTTARGTCEQVWCMFSLYILHLGRIWCTFWFSLRVNQIYGDSCKDLWILLTKCTPYYTVSGKSTCPILGWGTPRTCDVYGCMSAIFSHSTRTEYQATHLPSPRMWNPKNMWCFHRAQEHSITCPALGCGTPRTAQSATPSRLRTRFSSSAGATWEVISCKFGK